MSCYKDIKLKYKQYEKIKELAKKIASGQITGTAADTAVKILLNNP